jgi:hypothetical protein
VRFEQSQASIFVQRIWLEIQSRAIDMGRDDPDSIGKGLLPYDGCSQDFSAVSKVDFRWQASYQSQIHESGLDGAIHEELHSLPLGTAIIQELNVTGAERCDFLLVLV